MLRGCHKRAHHPVDRIFEQPSRAQRPIKHTTDRGHTRLVARSAGEMFRRTERYGNRPGHRGHGGPPQREGITSFNGPLQAGCLAPAFDRMPRLAHAYALDRV
jgi:hypothetical protein